MDYQLLAHGSEMRFDNNNNNNNKIKNYIIILFFIFHLFLFKIFVIL